MDDSTLADRLDRFYLMVFSTLPLEERVKLAREEAERLEPHVAKLSHDPFHKMFRSVYQDTCGYLEKAHPQPKRRP